MVPSNPSLHSRRVMMRCLFAVVVAVFSLMLALTVLAADPPGFKTLEIGDASPDFKFPYRYDGETQKPSVAYGVLATPQIYLFDQDRKLRYVGRIDDSDVKTVTSHDARNAIDALLAGQPVPVETTRTFGCSTKWFDKRGDAVKWLERANAEPVELKPIDEVALERLVRNDTDK